MTMLGASERPLAAVWPPEHCCRPREPSFFTRIPEADRDVVWPPTVPNNESDIAARVLPEDTLLTLKQELPLNQRPITYRGEAATVSRTPNRCCGDQMWPPAQMKQTTADPLITNRPPTPALRRPEFVSLQTLPESCPHYRLAPGMTHQQ